MSEEQSEFSAEEIKQAILAVYQKFGWESPPELTKQETKRMMGLARVRHSNEREALTAIVELLEANRAERLASEFRKIKPQGDTNGDTKEAEK